MCVFFEQQCQIQTNNQDDIPINQKYSTFTQAKSSIHHENQEPQTYFPRPKVHNQNSLQSTKINVTQSLESFQRRRMWRELESRRRFSCTLVLGKKVWDEAIPRNEELENLKNGEHNGEVM